MRYTPRVRNRKHQKSGMALATVLVCLAALVFILFTAVSASLSHLNVASAATRQDHAKNLAEAALSEAIVKLSTEQNGWQAGNVVVSSTEISDADGIVSMDRTGPFAARFSLNNLDNEDQVAGADGRMVPANTAHLVARGRVGNTERWMECYYYRPPFPDGLVTSGPVRASALKIVGVRTDSAYTGGDLGTIPVEEVVPGNLFSNSLTGLAPGDPAVSLENGSDISGSLGAAGQVAIDASTTVAGALSPNSEPRPIPDIDVRARISALEPNAIDLGSSHGDLELDENWFCKANSININGDLDLNGSALLVRGDLRVNGAIKGVGIVLVDGNVQINGGGGSVTGADQTALACTGDFLLQASNPETNYFKGLVYCEGDFAARRITVVGTTVVNGKAGKRGSADIENVRFVHTPGSVSLNLRKPEGVGVKRHGSVGSDDHCSALSFVRRLSPDSSELIYEIRGYASENSAVIASDKDNPFIWTKDPPYQDPTQAHQWPTGASRPSPVHIPLNSTEQQVRALAATLATAFCNWQHTATENAIKDGPDGKDKVRQLFADAMWADFNGDPDVYTISFDLNTLFPEFLDGNRILLWRDYKVD